MAWNVYLAADNEAIQHLFSRTFDKRTDLTLKFCETAEETIREVEENPPHLLIISINLPDKDGYDLCGELKERGVTFPVLLIEDIFEDIDLDRCLEVQTDGFIAKPFEEDLIAEKVDEVLSAGKVESEAQAEPAAETKPELEAAEKPEEKEDIVVEAEEETEEAAASALSYEEEEIPASELTASDEEEGVVELTDLIMEGKTEKTVEEVFVEEEEVPPAVTSALEESAQELAKMEAMESSPEAEEPKEEGRPVEGPAATPPTSLLSMDRETMERILSDIVTREVEETLREKLPGILRESLSKLFSDLSESLK